MEKIEVLRGAEGSNICLGDQQSNRRSPFLNNHRVCQPLFRAQGNPVRDDARFLGAIDIALWQRRQENGAVMSWVGRPGLKIRETNFTSA
jgi:hypothetical protein